MADTDRSGSQVTPITAVETVRDALQWGEPNTFTLIDAYDEESDTVYTRKGIIAQQDSFMEHGIHLRRHVDEYRLVTDDAGVELWSVKASTQDQPVYKGTIVDVERTPYFEGGYPESTFGETISGIQTLQCRDSGISGWYVMGHGSTKATWDELLALALEILASETAHQYTEMLGIDIDLEQFEPIEGGRPTAPFEEPSTSRLSGAKRANTVRVGQAWLCHGKDRSCTFEGYFNHMFVWALEVVASENTKSYIESVGAVSATDGTAYTPEVAELADELYTYTGKSFNYFEESPTDTLYQKETFDRDAIIRQRGWMTVGEDEREADVDHVVSKASDRIGEFDETPYGATQEVVDDVIPSEKGRHDYRDTVSNEAARQIRENRHEGAD